MTVKVAVSAEAADVLLSLDKIRDAIRRSGQEALNFSKIDLSHPELQFVASDLKVVQERLDGLHKVARGETAAGFRSTLGAAHMGPGDFLARHQEWLDQVNQRYPDAAARNRHIANFGRNIFGGTGFAPPPPAPPPGPPAPPPGEGGGGALGMIGGSAAGIAKAAGMFLLVQAGITKVADMAARALDQAEGEAMANDTLMRHVRDTGVDFDHLRDAVRETATGLRMTDDEMQRAALSWVKATNLQSSDDVMANVKTAAGFARGYGMDSGAAVGAFGRASYLGEDPRKFAMLIGDAVQAGGQTGQAQEVMNSLLKWSESASKLIVTGSNLDAYTAMYSGMNATGLPGMKGANAEGLIGQIDGAVRQGGGAGEASMALTYRALARRGITDPYQVQYMLDGGMFQQVGSGNETMFDVMRGEVNGAYGTMPHYQRLNAMSRMFGINTRQAEALDKFKPGDIGRTSAILKKYQLNPNDVDPSALADIGEVMGTASLEPMRAKIMKRTDISDDERAALGRVKGDDLRELMVRVLAEHGQDKTVATRLQQSDADLSNALTKAGGGLIGAVADMKGATAGLADQIGKLSTVLGDWYEDMRKLRGPDAPLYDGNGLPVVDENNVQLNRAGKPYVAPGPRTGNIPTSGEADRNAGIMHDTLMATGHYTEQQVGGILGGASLESGMDPYSINKSSGMPGLMNWDTHRRGIFLDKYKHAINDPNIPAPQLVREQSEFIDYEYMHEEAAAYRALRQTTTAGDAAKSVNSDYLRSNDYGRPDAEKGEKYYQRFGRGQQLPEDDPSLGAAPKTTQHAISPLRVIHEKPDGTPIGDEYLPFTTVGPPQAAGAPQYWPAR